MRIRKVPLILLLTIGAATSAFGGQFDSMYAVQSRLSSTDLLQVWKDKFAGLFLAAKLASVRASIAQGFEMEVIAMAILGGASPSGGKGRVGGVILGVFTIGLIRYGTGLVNISSETLKIIIGCLLIVVCAVPNLRQVLADAKEARRGRAGLL